METTLNQFIEYNTAANTLFNSLGAINPGRDACFFGVPRGVMAQQMLQLSKRTKETDPEVLLGWLRQIYGSVEHAVAGGLSHDCRVPLIETLVLEFEPS